MEINYPAGFMNRFLAYVLDSIIILMATGLISFVLYGVFYDSENYYPTDILGLIYTLLLPVLWFGYTIGRRIAGNRIVRIDGRKVGIGTMILRVIVAGIAYALTLGIGLIVSAFMVGLREDKRSIHDFIAQTYVTTNPPTRS
ncbi:RDD family protein [Jeotgalibacillus salarius]|uniref:RDD family protein n=1 Tax=Jeotgalibacillus salarius TaxID=546023 RepID=A0A4Y8LPX8_9BACL|nr:RDD family protein [Jeotgalibacillus salarius]TFE04061.1 RDD family protein [Jeotgalibacillus salarius]